MSASDPNAPCFHPFPATDFPPGVANLYQATFRYPKGYFPSTTRVTDPDVLRAFEPWQRPYVKRDEGGATFVDESIDGMRKLLHPSDGSVLRALRYVQWSGPADSSLQETFACEDRTDLAETLSKTGHHGAAINTILALPTPFQQTGLAQSVLLRSHAALAQYEQALKHARTLAIAADITDYARDLYRLEEAHLLLLLGRRVEAEILLNHGRTVFRKFYLYYGLRAALAWMNGEGSLVRALIVRAGRASPYHSPKLLWSPLLRPVYPIVRQELLDTDNGPLVYRRDKDVCRLCHRLQGALLTGKLQSARNLAEGLTPTDILEGDTAEQFVLCLAGLGEFVRLRDLAKMLPGWNGQSLRLSACLADAILEPGSATARVLGELIAQTRCNSAVRAAWTDLLPHLALDKIPTRIALAERVLGSVSDRWEESGRQHFMLVEREDCFEAQGIWQRSGDPVHFPRGVDLRAEVDVNTVEKFEGAEDFYRWLEEKLAENQAMAHIQLPRPRWETYVSGFGLLTLDPPRTQATPLVAELLACLAKDPSLFFSNGPITRCYGMNTPFADRLLKMLAIHLASIHQPSGR